MSGDTVIKVDHVSKNFVLPHEKVTTVKGLFTSVFKKRTKTKEVQHALKDVSFGVKKGEFFGIVGRNGSGKSTMLKMLAAIYQPTKGEIHVSGRLVPFIELGVGFNPELTGRENVYLNGAMMGFSEKQVDAMYADIVAFAELEAFMDQKLKNYSSGMQVRLAFSVAIRADADILLIDEVLAVGDAAFQRKCLEYFRKLKKDGVTVVFVSHDMDSIRQFCDRAVLIEKNEVVKEGGADEIAELYSKMFAEEVAREARREAKTLGAEDRWGSMVVSIESPKVSTRVVTDNTDYIELGGVLVAGETTEQPTIGFRISDDAGRPITGANTILLHRNDIVLEAGTKSTFSWRVPNIFSNGNYEVNLAVTDQNGNPLDVRNGVLSFKVVKASKTPYIITPRLGFDLQQ